MISSVGKSCLDDTARTKGTGERNARPESIHVSSKVPGFFTRARPHLNGTAIVRPGATFQSIKAMADDAEPLKGTPSWAVAIASFTVGVIWSSLFYAGMFG